MSSLVNLVSHILCLCLRLLHSNTQYYTDLLTPVIELLGSPCFPLMREETTCCHGDGYITISITTVLVLIQLAGLDYNSRVM